MAMIIIVNQRQLHLWDHTVRPYRLPRVRRVYILSHSIP
jgi:hypothetical protein